MKRLPLFFTVAAVVALSVSLAFWWLQLFKAPQRPIAAPPARGPVALNIDAAKGLFGGEISVAVASNYQLKGVVAARGPVSADSAAILAVDGKPALALSVGREVAPGVVVKEVHPKFVVLSEGGVLKRIDLASDAGVSSMAPAVAGMQPGMQPGAPAPQQQQQQQQQQQPQPAPQQAPPMMQQNSPPRPGQQNIAVPGFDRQQ